jgi:DUF4097 and DUF4098 domain-containing protein YvlB
MRHSLLLTALIGTTALLSACGAGVNGDVTATQAGASTVNGSVHVPAGIKSGAVGTVNGGIDIGENATVAKASTVNGPIELGAHATADAVETVNGGVTLASGAHVAHSVVTVNGGMHLNAGADVGGRVQNVNGHITVKDAHVGGGLETVGGDIDVTGSSHIEGGIRVQKSSGWFNWDPRKPRIVIGPGVVVQGDLRFEREVLLYVSDKATVGPITGASAVSFSGDNAPQ